MKLSKLKVLQQWPQMRSPPRTVYSGVTLTDAIQFKPAPRGIPGVVQDIDGAGMAIWSGAGMEAAGSRQDMEALARLWIVHSSLQVGSALAILVSRSVFSSAQSDH